MLPVSGNEPAGVMLWLLVAPVAEMLPAALTEASKVSSFEAVPGLRRSWTSSQFSVPEALMTSVRLEKVIVPLSAE